METKGTPQIQGIADSILRAAGSGLRHYSMHSIREAIFAATEKAITEARLDVVRENELLKIMNAGFIRELAETNDRISLVLPIIERDFPTIHLALTMQWRANSSLIAKETGKEAA